MPQGRMRISTETFSVPMVAATMEIVEERRLVEAARKRDRAAFNRLVCLHRRHLHAFLNQSVGPDASEDVLQETLLAAWQAIPRLELRVRFRSWLFGIAARKAVDHHRWQCRCRKHEIPLEPETAEIEARLAVPVPPTAERDTATRLLARLTREQRQLLEMYYFTELTLAEIAVRLNCNLNTIKYRFYRVHAVAAQHRDVLTEYVG
ncbi:MAG: RNA polymerase sigma factor [Capsulimonadales bacterium]|nr:RNA polymerase sigma factor [Capsulimonadales bacterium]